MLKFYETFQRYGIPESLKGEIYNRDGEKLNIIDDFSKVNVFIGPNNSGKSKIIRELIKQKPIPYYGNTNRQTITNLIKSFFETVEEKLSEVYPSKFFLISNSGNGVVLDTQQILSEKDQLLSNDQSHNIVSIIDYLEMRFVKLPLGLHRNTSWYIREPNSPTVHVAEGVGILFLKKIDEIKEHTTLTIERLRVFQFPVSTETDVPRIYIPSIRSLRLFAAGENIREQTKKEYDFDDLIKIYNGQDLPKEVFSLTNAPYSKRQKIIRFERLLSKEFFESKDVKLTYDQEKNVLLIKIGEEMERPIHELGDGLQMIIILTFPFFSNELGIVAIEAELFIHPGLQKTFIKFLISNSVTKNFQIFLATHSNHIIDSINQSALVSLFSIRKREKTNDPSIEKIPDFIVENLAFGNENLLNLLGITSTSVYLSNCTVWVEGITDKLYIQKFILEYLKGVKADSKYLICKEYKEGINYSFVLTGGDSIIHWDFSDDGDYYNNTKKIQARKFCSKSLVIVDNDFGKNHERKKLLKELLNNRFIELDNPEIENFLSQDVINKTVLSYLSVAKVVNIDDLPTVEKSDFESKKIGYIIDEIILKDYEGVKLFSSGDKDSSSLKSGDKFVFCNKALEYVESDNLTQESRELVEKILDFVISQNNFL